MPVLLRDRGMSPAARLQCDRAYVTGAPDRRPVQTTASLRSRPSLWIAGRWENPTDESNAVASETKPDQAWGSGIAFPQIEQFCCDDPLTGRRDTIDRKKRKLES